MGALKLTYHESQTAISENWKIFVRGIEKNASSQNFCKDYFTFGMQMPGRSYNSTEYRWGFGGVHEKDDEVHGVTGSWLDFGGYGYDTRIVQRPCPDPLAAKYPGMSPYAAFGNNPNYYIDIDGQKIIPLPLKEDNSDTKIALRTHFDNKFGNELGGIMMEMINNKLEWGNNAFDGITPGSELPKYFDKALKGLDKELKKEAKAYKEKIMNNEANFILIAAKKYEHSDKTIGIGTIDINDFKEFNGYIFDNFEEKDGVVTATGYRSSDRTNASLSIIITDGTVKVNNSGTGTTFEYPISNDENEQIEKAIVE